MLWDCSKGGEYIHVIDYYSLVEIHINDSDFDMPTLDFFDIDRNGNEKRYIISKLEFKR